MSSINDGPRGRQPGRGASEQNTERRGRDPKPRTAAVPPVAGTPPKAGALPGEAHAAPPARGRQAAPAPPSSPPTRGRSAALRPLLPKLATSARAAPQSPPALPTLPSSPTLAEHFSAGLHLRSATKRPVEAPAEAASPPAEPQRRRLTDELPAASHLDASDVFSAPFDPTQQIRRTATLRPTQDVAALNLVLLGRVPAKSAAAVKKLRLQSESLFLQGGGSRQAALALLLRTQQKLEALGLSDLLQQSRQLFAQAYTEPTRVGHNAVSALQAYLGEASGTLPVANVQAALAAVQAGIQAVQDRRAAAAAGPAVAAAGAAPLDPLAVEMDDVLGPIAAALAPVEAALLPVTQALNILGAQGRTTSRRASELAELHAGLQAATPPPSPQLLSAIKDAEHALWQGVELARLRKLLLPQQDPTLQEGVMRRREELATALARGASLPALRARALAVAQLRSMVKDTPELADVLATALRERRSVASLLPTDADAPFVDGCLALLTQADRAKIDAKLEVMATQGATAVRPVTLAGILRRLPLVAGDALLSPRRQAPSEANEVRALQQVAQLPAEMLFEIAQAPVRARALLAAATNDADASLAQALADRLAELSPTPAALNDNEAGRAFESLLAKHLVQNMPPSVQQAWTTMGQAMANFLQLRAAPPNATRADAQTKENLAWMNFRAHLLRRGVRPWHAQEPQMKGLLALATSGSTKLKEAALQMLAQPATNGYQVIARANLLRDLWVSFHEEGMVAPNARKANAFYGKEISPRTARTGQDRRLTLRSMDAPEAKKRSNPGVRAATGIMANHQALPPGTEDALAATLPALANSIDVSDPFIQESLQHGGVTASGVSGSTNILLHAAEEFIEQGWKLAMPEVFLGAAEFVVHDGGHSFFEAMWVQDHFSERQYSAQQPGTTPQSYAQLQAQFAGSPQVQRAFKAAMAEMTAFLAGGEARRLQQERTSLEEAARYDAAQSGGG